MHSTNVIILATRYTLCPANFTRTQRGYIPFFPPLWRSSLEYPNSLCKCTLQQALMNAKRASSFSRWCIFNLLQYFATRVRERERERELLFCNCWGYAPVANTYYRGGGRVYTIAHWWRLTLFFYWVRFFSFSLHHVFITIVISILKSLKFYDGTRNL